MALLSGWLLLALQHAPAQAGAWVREAGGAYVHAGVARFVGTADFDPEAGRFTGDAVELYGEVGVGHRLELDGSLRGVDHRSAGLPTHSTGLQDAWLVAKWAPTRSEQALALVAGTRVALYGREDTGPQRGPGGVDLLTGASWGRGLQRGWVGVDVLHRLRFGGASSGLDFRTELGWRPVEALALAATAQAQPAFGRAVDQPPDAPAPVPTVVGVGAKALLALGGGVGLAADTVWLPPLLNDGPGARAGIGLTLQR